MIALFGFFDWPVAPDALRLAERNCNVCGWVGEVQVALWHDEEEKAPVVVREFWQCPKCKAEHVR